MLKLSLKQLNVDPGIIDPYLDTAKNGREAVTLVEESLNDDQN
jgi:hypothetical protein